MTCSFRRTVRAVSVAAVIGSVMLVGMSASWAQQPAANDDGVKAASTAFYAALSGTDVAAMKEVSAHTPYVVYVGPQSKSLVCGWPAVEAAWEQSFASRSRRVALAESYILTDGNIAWEVGTETGTVKLLKDGSESKTDNIVTNVYEKQNGRWLMVSHHAQAKPQ